MPIGSQNFVYKFVGVDAYSVAAGKVARSAAKVQAKTEAAGRSAAAMAAKWQSAGAKLRGVGANLSIFSVALGALGGMAISKAADMEMISKSFEVFVGDADQAKASLAGLIEFSKKTPFLFQDVAQMGKHLLAMGLSVKELPRTVKMLGELASASNRPLREVGELWGKIITQGRVTGEEVLSLASKGVNVTKMLSDITGMTAFEVKKEIEKGALTFTLVDQLVTKLTTGTGILSGLTEDLSTTLTGMWSTFRGNMDLALISMGNTIVKTFGVKEGMLDLNLVVEDLATNFAVFAEENEKLTKAGMFGALGLVLLGPLVLLLGQMTLAVGGLISLWGALGTAVAWVALFPAAIAQATVGVGLWATASTTLAVIWGGIATAVSVVVGLILSVPVLIGVALGALFMLWQRWDEFDWSLKGLIPDFAGIARNLGLSEPVVIPIEWEGIPDFAHTLGITEPVGFEGAGGTRNETQTNIDVRIHANPGTTVDAIQSTTRGDTSMMGVNLAHSLG